MFICSTAGLCIVRTVLNWQTYNFDPTWEGVPNYIIRHWEICVGVIAACIPALRPGYCVVITSISTNCSLRHRSSFSQYHQSNSESGCVGRIRAKMEGKCEDVEEKAHLAKEISHPEPVARDYPATRAIAHLVSVQAGHAAEVVAGKEENPIEGTKGNSGTMEQGITKTTWFGTESEAESQNQSLGDGDLERGECRREFA